MSAEKKGRIVPKEVGEKEAIAFSKTVKELLDNAPKKLPLINFLSGDADELPHGEIGAYKRPDGSWLNVSKSIARADQPGATYGASRRHPREVVGEYIYERHELFEAYIPPLESSDEPHTHMMRYGHTQVFDKNGKMVPDSLTKEILEGKVVDVVGRIIEKIDSEPDDSIVTTEEYTKTMEMLESFKKPLTKNNKSSDK